MKNSLQKHIEEITKIRVQVSMGISKEKLDEKN